jgi:hypothetical protein
MRLTGVGHTRYDLEVQASKSSRLVLHQFYYPGWEATGDGALQIPRSAQPSGVLGLAAFDLPAVSGQARVRLASTPAQFWGSLFSMVACLVVVVGLFAWRQISKALGGFSVTDAPETGGYRAQAWHPSLPLVLALACLLLAVVLIASLVLPNGRVQAPDQVQANLEDTVELLASAADKARYQPGDTVQVTLFWRALRQMDRDYKAFVHLTDAAMTRQPAQHDGDPGGGYTPTTRWELGELVPDRHPLRLPADLLPGKYRLWAGMYEFNDSSSGSEEAMIRNLDVISSDVPVADNRILLGEIEVLSR